MNRPTTPGDELGLFRVVRFPGFEVSWAGVNPVRGGSCFGSEDGQLLNADADGTPVGEPFRISASGEAINGVAASGAWLAAATRQEVTFLGVPDGPGLPPRIVALPLGAHGVTVTPGGHFAAPLGRLGLAFVPAGVAPEEGITLISPTKQDVYFYRAVALRGQAGEDLVACATRRGGVGVTAFRPVQQTYRLSTVTPNALDIVDVCALGQKSGPAVAAVGRDGTLVLIRDLVRDKRPVTLKYDTIQGTAYRILSCRGHLFLLTSHGMYGLINLAANFLAGEMGQSPTPILTVRMGAVDANLIDDRWLLTVLPGEVRQFDVELIERRTPEGLADGEVQAWQPREIAADWEEYGIEQAAKQVADV